MKYKRVEKNRLPELLGLMHALTADKLQELAPQLHADVCACAAFAPHGKTLGSTKDTWPELLGIWQNQPIDETFRPVFEFLHGVAYTNADIIAKLHASFSAFEYVLRDEH